MLTSTWCLLQRYKKCTVIKCSFRFCRWARVTVARNGLVDKTKFMPT
eukprot:IDg5209t1